MLLVVITGAFIEKDEGEMDGMGLCICIVLCELDGSSERLLSFICEFEVGH